MDSYSHKVSLKKPVQPEPWTDPETGEIYPGGKPSPPRLLSRRGTPQDSLSPHSPPLLSPPREGASAETAAPHWNSQRGSVPAAGTASSATDPRSPCSPSR